VKWIRALTAVLAVAALAAAAPGKTDDLASTVEPLMAKYHVPGVVIAKIEDGKVAWVRGFGMASDDAKVSDDTVFEAASLSKPLFALAVMKMAATGPLDLDRPLTWVMNKPWPEDPQVQKITARMVLDHTSGLPNRADGPLEVMFPPGSRWSYSGEGYRLLQRALHDLTGQSLESLVRGAAIVPISMRSTSWRPAPGVALATGHDRDGHPIAASAPDTPDAASSLLTTAGDYAKFVAAIVNARVIDMRPPTIELTRTPQVDVDKSLGLAWGLGWAIQRTDVGNVFFQWGSNPGFKAFALGDPVERDGIVILTNGDNGLEIAEPVTKAVLGRTWPLFKFRMMHPDD